MLAIRKRRFVESITLWLCTVFSKNCNACWLLKPLCRNVASTDWGR